MWYIQHTVVGENNLFCYQVKGYKRNKQSRKKLRQESKELNIPRRNCMKMKKEFEKAIVETQHKYKDIIFVYDSRILEGCLKEL